MANEITVNVTLTATKGGASVTSGSKSKQLDMTGSDLYHATQNIGTSDEAVSFGDITGAPKKVSITNLDSTNYVELSLSTGGGFAADVFETLVAGDTYTGSPGATIYAKANTASVLIDVVAAEA